MNLGQTASGCSDNIPSGSPIWIITSKLSPVAVMAELDIGQHCSYSECKQLDFLPVTCKRCGLVFCKDHSYYDSHDCTGSAITEDRITCPGEKSYQCECPGCQKSELTEIICNSCGKNFCLAHRHQSDHVCEKLEAPKPRMLKTSQHIADILQKSEPSHGPVNKKLTKKAQQTAAKVNLMKLKMKAAGPKGIPQSDRVFFNVLLPTDSKAKAKAMFTSRHWSVGRAIDAFAAEANLKNDNNILGSNKLKLFTFVGDILLPDRTLESYLLEEFIFNGSDVILEYVNNEVDHLEDTSVYKL